MFVARRCTVNISNVSNQKFNSLSFRFTEINIQPLPIIYSTSNEMMSLFRVWISDQLFDAYQMLNDLNCSSLIHFISLVGFSKKKWIEMKLKMTIIKMHAHTKCTSHFNIYTQIVQIWKKKTTEQQKPILNEIIKIFTFLDLNRSCGDIKRATGIPCIMTLPESCKNLLQNYTFRKCAFSSYFRACSNM